MAELAQIMDALRKADAAGNTQDAQRLAQMAANARSQATNTSQPSATESYAKGFWRTAANSILGGLGSEVAGVTYGAVGAAKAALDPNIPWSKVPTVAGRMYTAGEKQARGLENAFQAQNPKTALAENIAGSFANPVNLAIAPYAFAGRGVSLAEKIARGFAGGVAIGGATAAATAPPGNRMSAGLSGALTGGAVGAVLPAAISGVGKLGSGIANQVLGRTEVGKQGVAVNKIINALVRDGLTPEQAAQKVKKLGPQGALLDAGPNLRGLVRAVATVPGTAKKTVGDFLTKRQEGTRLPATNVLAGTQSQRIEKAIKGLVPGDVRAAQADTVAARKALGASYEQAKNAGGKVDIKPLLTPLGKEISISKGLVKSSLQKVRALLTKDGANAEKSIRNEVTKKFGNIKDPIVRARVIENNVKKLISERKGKNIEDTVSSLHQAKMAIDELMSGNALTSMSRTMKTRIRSYQDQLVSAIESSPGGAAYKAGRLGTAGQWRINDALDMGSGFMQGKDFKLPQDVASAVAKMTPEEITAFRTGAASALIKKIGDVPIRGDATKKIMDIPNLEVKIRAAFGNDATFKKYIDKLMAEKTMFKGYSILGNSQTAEKLAEQADAGMSIGQAAFGASQMATKNPFSIVMGAGNVISVVGKKLLNTKPSQATLAKMLIGSDVSALTKPAQKALRNKKVRDQLLRILMQPAVAQTGRGQGQ